MDFSQVDGRWVAVLIVGIILFWVGVGWLVWQALQ